MRRWLLRSQPIARIAHVKAINGLGFRVLQLQPVEGIPLVEALALASPVGLLVSSYSGA